MNRLTILEMQEIEGGSPQAVSCGLSIIGLVAATAGLLTLTAATGGLAVFAAVVSFSVAPAATAVSCLAD